MQSHPLHSELTTLNSKLTGTIKWDRLHQYLYATDASVYKRNPLAVAYPKGKNDLQEIIAFAQQHKIGLIPRTAGTSLAGQCVGEGIVVDVSKHFTKILKIDPKQKTVTVQPGVNRDALNQVLAPLDLFFGPNTSTSQYCLLGGMLGNNSSGTTSIRYGVTRDKVIAVKALLSDGSEVVFKPCTASEIKEKAALPTLEGEIYRQLEEMLSDPKTQEGIRNEFPEASIHRRNTGYALDVLIDQRPFTSDGSLFNISKLLAGSEGTLAITTAITFALEPLPPKHSAMLALHFKSIHDAMNAVVPVMEHHLYTCELIDKTILDCTKGHPGFKEHRFFIQGDPKAILLLELRNNDKEILASDLQKLEATVAASGWSYAAVPLWDEAIDKANALRHAGLGLLGNMIGDQKAVACIEDTAVPLPKLADYIDEFEHLMLSFDQNVVYYAHAGAGELHLRPILNLKTKEGVRDFRAITEAVARLVKKYNGSLSGEHGDGIVRSEFIPIVVGEENYNRFKQIKTLFDPNGIFNPGKIVDPYPMDEQMRTSIASTPEFETAFDFSADQGIYRAAEKCNGAGACRSTLPKGTLCPSYRATKEEKHNTRGRANVLREVLSNQKSPNAFDDADLKDVFDLCLSCKACATECPSSVDIATYKAEFLYQYHKSNPRSLRDRLFAFSGKLSKKNQSIRGLHNFMLTQPLLSSLIKKGIGIAKERSLPKLEKSLYPSITQSESRPFQKKVYVYLDEFTNYHETEIGKEALLLLKALGYNVTVLPPSESGRTYISKGFLEEAKKCADTNILKYHPLLSEEIPLIGIEPSAIYTFTDEYIKLSSYPNKAKEVAQHCYLIEAFLAQEIEKGVLKPSLFHLENKEVKIHAHCYQKALGSPADTFKILSLPTNYTVRLMNTGCCGMAGSFGFEKEHYEISQLVGEERLFPAIRKANQELIIAANGTSCRHQIQEGTGRKSLHPVQILYRALQKKT